MAGIMGRICILLLMLTSVMAIEQCQPGINCNLPDCFCGEFEHPYMDRTDIPQMVYFGFDDSVNTHVTPHYDYLFRREHENPNGCPIGMTLYVSHRDTDYSILGAYYKRGFEIGVHSVTHTDIDTRAKVLQEAGEERTNIATLAGIPLNEIVGWRSPNLRVGDGDDHVEALQQLGYMYDISFTNVKLRKDDKSAWPCTMDFGWPYTKSSCRPRCPKQSHNGFWGVPVNTVFDGTVRCVYTDGCPLRPTSVDDAYNFIMDNFLSHYHGNRAPFGLNMHAAWFFHNYTRDGMDRAIEDMLKLDDVYIITVKQVLEWMKQPTKSSDITSFKPWKCPGHVSLQDKEIDKGIQVKVGLTLIMVTVVGVAAFVIFTSKYVRNRKKQFHLIHNNEEDADKAEEIGNSRSI